MGLWDRIKAFLISLGAGKEAKPEPPKKRRDGYSMARPDAQEELSEFQGKKPTKPAALDTELSEVLDGVIDKTPATGDSGLFAKKGSKPSGARRP